MGEALIVLLPKDRYRPKEPSLQRPISLTNAWYKILDKIIANRIASHFERNGILSEPQYGFRKGRSTTDQMLTLELLTQIQSRRVQETHIMLIDLQKAFDSVDRELLFELLENTGIDDTVSDILKSAYSSEQSSLLLNKRRTAPF